ncbi:hypothetical protein [Bradyrhizobium sp. BWA-3-5]|uniref:hypothetical protein n=1 Tax=Bradyrhizobium sp. BWA-3-5 TaxID=3080013 RepID=UPI00293F217E|nr:hypothetical protein [Bradyrhizobium sp. BWA-3-5]WOH67398.1 hypothetical protein RX331_06500 [Bradyrhizobium sp. BWA-3-5]
MSKDGCRHATAGTLFKEHTGDAKHSERSVRQFGFNAAAAIVAQRGDDRDPLRRPVDACGRGDGRDLEPLNLFDPEPALTDPKDY